MKIEAIVFDLNGNRFLVPGYWWSEDESGVDAICNSMLISVVTGAKKEPGYMQFDANDAGVADLIHVPFCLVGRQFANGGIDVLLISGPLFDKAMAAPPATAPGNGAGEQQAETAG